MKIPHKSIIYGTVILTGVSFLCRGIGFFYRMFISQTFGEEGMGIYQLTAPIMSMAFSLCCAGFQTAISRYVAAKSDDENTSLRFLFCGLAITTVISSLFSAGIYFLSDFLSSEILLETRTAPLLRLLSLAFPFSAIHCCVNGYFYGKKKAGIPALLQLTEQLARVGSVYLLCQFYIMHNYEIPLALTAAGSAIAEVISTIVSLGFILPKLKRIQTIHAPKNTLFDTATCLLSMALPLSISRIIVNLLQNVENIYIPEMLRRFGCTTAESLSLFGVLTGMTLTVILLPSSLINSVSVLLLPRISEAQASGQNHTISYVIRRSVTFCCIMGLFFSTVFFLSGKWIGNFLFHSETAGDFIVKLSFICPFLYITSSLGSILHGLGKTYTTLFINIGTLLIRIASVFFLIPETGLSGYILGLLAGQCFSAVCCIFSLHKYTIY